MSASAARLQDLDELTTPTLGLVDDAFAPRGGMPFTRRLPTRALQLRHERAAEKLRFAEKARTLASDAADDATLFHGLLDLAVTEYGVRRADLAMHVRTTLPTISRWLEGRHAPAPFVRSGVIQCVCDLIVASVTDRGLANVAPLTPGKN